MPLPTIADCYRIAIDWIADGGHTATNVIHVLSPTGDEADVAESVASNFSANMFTALANSAEIIQLTVTELDGTPDGRVFGQTALAGWAPAGGLKGDAGTQFTPQVAALIKLATGATGRSGRGRVFLPFVAEAASNNGALEALSKSNTTAGWVAFANGLVSDGRALCVASYLHSSASQVLELACEPITATMRKRNKR